MDLYQACFFICHVNYIKIRRIRMAMKYLENNMTQRTACPIFWAPKKSFSARYAPNRARKFWSFGDISFTTWPHKTISLKSRVNLWIGAQRISTSWKNWRAETLWLWRCVFNLSLDLAWLRLRSFVNLWVEVHHDRSPA